jgi:hypothetical protein
MRGSRIGSSFLAVFFVLTITFCLVSAGIFKANTSIGMAAYATKSEGSSGGDSSDGGGGKGSSSGDGGDSSDKGRDNSGGDSSGSTGAETGGDNNNPTTEEPNAPPPPPPPTCEQGSTSPECSTVPEPPPPGSIDCSTTPNDPSCKTTPGGPTDCNTNPTDPSCKPPVDCKTNPDDPSCTQPPPPVDCKANPNDASCTQPVDCTKTPNDPSCKPDCTKNTDDPSCKVDCTTNPSDPSCPTPCQPAVIGISCPPTPECKSDEHLENGKCVKNGPGPDDDCLFNPGLNKCKAMCDENNNCQCPKGFSMNEDDHCFPDKPCPKGFERHNEDETGKCFPITCPPGQHFDPKVNKCVPICPDGTELLNGKCPTKTLSLSISVDKDPIIRGHEQTITVTVSDKDTHQKISGANVKITVGYTTGFQHTCSSNTDGSGKAVCKWTISGNAKPGTFKVTATASKDGYESVTGTKSFMVKPAESDTGGGGGGGQNHGASTSSSTAAAVQQVKYFKEFTDMPANSPLYIINTSMHKDILNDIIITGEIKNRGTSTANFVELIATFYNINNQTVGNENTFTKPSTLQAGQAAPFTMYLSPKDMLLDQIKSVKYHLNWKHAVSTTTTTTSSSLTPSSPASKTLLPNTNR